MSPATKAAADFMQSMDVKGAEWCAAYRAEHRDSDQAEVDAYCRGFLEAHGMWAALTVMRMAK